MKPTRIEFSPEASTSFRTLMDELIKETESIEDLVLRAATSGDDMFVTLCNINPESPEEPKLVCIEIGQSSKETMRLEVKLSEMEHPEAVNIASFFHGYDERGDILLDDPAIDAWEKSIGFRPCKTLGNTIGHRCSLFPFIASFMKSGSGEVDISHSFFDDYEEYPDDERALHEEGLSRDRMVFISALCKTEKVTKGPTPGFGTDRYFYL